MVERDELPKIRILMFKGELGATRTSALNALLAFLPGELGTETRRKIADEAWKREYDLCTYLGDGLALPHARVDGLDEIILIAGSASVGIKWPGNNQKARIILLLCLPERMAGEYLRIARRLMIFYKEMRKKGQDIYLCGQHEFKKKLEHYLQ